MWSQAPCGLFSAKISWLHFLCRLARPVLFPTCPVYWPQSLLLSQHTFLCGPRLLSPLWRVQAHSSRFSPPAGCRLPPRVRHSHRSAQEQSRARKQCSHRESHVHGHHPALSLSYRLQAVKLEDVGPCPLAMWSHCTKGVQVNSRGDGSHGVNQCVINLFLHLNLSLHAHKCINHLVDELDLGHLFHLLDSQDYGDLSVCCCQCGLQNRANNGGDWNHALDNRIGMCDVVFPAIRMGFCTVCLMISDLSTLTVLTTCWRCVFTTCFVFSFVRVTSMPTIFSASEMAGISMICSPKNTVEPCPERNPWRPQPVPPHVHLCHLTDTCSAQTLRCLSAMNRLGLWGLSGFLDNIQLWDLNCLFRDMCLRNVLDPPQQGINHPVCTLQLWNLNGLLNSPVNGDLSLRRDRDNAISKRTGWIATRFFLCDLSGFRISGTGTLGGPALSITCCTVGKVSVTVTFHLVVQRLRLINARRWDEVLVHDCKNAFTDLLEFSFHFRDVLSLACESSCSFSMLGDDAPRCTSTVDSVLFGGTERRLRNHVRWIDVYMWINVYFLKAVLSHACTLEVWLDVHTGVWQVKQMCIRRTNTLRYVGEDWKILQNSIAPSSSRCTFFHDEKDESISSMPHNWMESECSPGSTSVQLLFPTGNVLVEGPAGSHLCGFVLAFDRLAKSFASNFNAYSPSCTSGISCS